MLLLPPLKMLDIKVLLSLLLTLLFISCCSKQKDQRSFVDLCIAKSCTLNSAQKFKLHALLLGGNL